MGERSRQRQGGGKALSRGRVGKGKLHAMVGWGK